MTIKMEAALPQPSTDTIRRVEAELGLTLPASYVAALAFLNGARPEINFFEDDGKTYEVANFLPVVELPYHKRLMDDFNPSSRVPIAGDSCGNSFCMGTDGDECGIIYFADHEIPGDDAFHRIASSLEDFLERLQVDDDPSRWPEPAPGGEVWIDPAFKEFLDKYR